MKHIVYIFFSLIISFFVCGESFAQSLDISLHWNPPLNETLTDSTNTIFLSCKEAGSNDRGLPQITRHIPLARDIISVTGILDNAIFVPLTDEEQEAVKNQEILPEIVLSCNLVWERKKPNALISFMPLKFNTVTGRTEKLVSCTVKLSSTSGKGPMEISSHVYASHSVLASGNWYRIGVRQTGICRITYADLSSMGINPALIDPRNIRVYGNGGKMLPERNSSPRQDDLAENAVEVVGEADGVFNEGDYILFYAEGPLVWKYSATNGRFEHTSHLYSELSCYFLTTDLGPGKRIGSEINSGIEATDIVNEFDDYALHEKNLVNLIKSGRQWFGESFEVQNSYSFNFSFPNIVLGSDVSIRSNFVARSLESSSFSVTASGTNWNVSVGNITNEANDSYAKASLNVRIIPAVNPSFDVSVRYNKPLTTSLGWIDYVEINARRALTFIGGHMLFRDSRSALPGHVSQFILAGASNAVKVWEVTDPLNVSAVATSVQGSNLTFRIATDTIREFAAFDGTYFVPMSFIEKVSNQDLHAQRGFDMLIISPPAFTEQATRLANYHAAVDGLRPVVINPQLIYNEFSSGMQDITAIRDFIKMRYDLEQGSDTLSYVLLFGDGSYDNMNRLQENTNFIPTFQTPESFNPVNSAVTDDYYVFLDNGEGNGAYDMIDVGIGRLPVKTTDEARHAVDKILNYDSRSPAVMGDWRNVICFVADDEDERANFIGDTESLAAFVSNSQSDYNIDKIYSDAYQQISAPGGQRYPDVNKAITMRVDKGALIINYIGHGGEVGWSAERVLGFQDINSWKNYDRLPVFLTATCEFSRFDDPGRTSAGEMVFLNPVGGGIALFTTTRPTYGAPNLSWSRSFYHYAFSTNPEGKHLRMGDVLLRSKRDSGSDANGKKFVLIGDPAIRMAYPDLKIETLSVNNRPVTDSPDTIRALSHVFISGRITFNNGQTATGFNGTITPSVFDKATPYATLGNDGNSKYPFLLQKSILYKGIAEVKHGLFSFSFVVPRDIAYQFDFGRISYYASDSVNDASGSYKNIVIGGFEDGIVMDRKGPLINLFMNDDRFVSGGITDENPKLFARVSDENGINTIGNGIGHDILAVLDNVSDKPFILNDYYQAETNTFTEGQISFPFSNLSPGLHTLTLRAWDVFNNSSEAYTEFIVKPSSSFTLGEVLNYPNPFSDQTYFTFEHNQPDMQMDVNIEIFDVTGKKMKTITGSNFAGGYKADPILWNGTADNGSPLRSGIYIYRVTATTADGRQQHGSGKLAIARSIK